MGILNTNETAVKHMHNVAVVAAAAGKSGEPSDVTVRLGAHEFTIAEVAQEIASTAPVDKPGNPEFS